MIYLLTLKNQLSGCWVVYLLTCKYYNITFNSKKHVYNPIQSLPLRGEAN